ncbi:hypothetical protein [Streptomyces subrutilus]|uniref:hypothetical protein n=1 Tax=Streptomyces subrutilus TaxID=36818 RepID=UPI0033D65891
MKSANRVAATFDNTPAGTKEASEWMRAGGEEHVYVSEEQFSLDERMAYVDDDLSRGADAVWGYYSQNGRYVSRALVACPRAGARCPYER